MNASNHQNPSAEKQLPASNSNYTSQRVEEAKAYVQELFEKELQPHFFFHNMEHVNRVHAAAVKLAKAVNLPQKERHILEMAALFHSTGFTKSSDNFWQHSQAIAENFLANHGADKEFIQSVNHLIGSLGDEPEPESQLEKLFFDAHNCFIGQKKFKRNLKLMKKEKEAIDNTSIDDRVWEIEQLSRLKSHVYFTPEAEELYGSRKQKNLKKEKKKVKKLKKENEANIKATSISANSGARTMFKTALRNHIDLTNIADQKANIMLSINALIITIGLPAFATYLSGTSYLIVPATIFLLTSVATMIIATISTRPVKTDGTTDLSKLMSGKTNLFFFGNFYKMDRREYQEAIKSIVSEREHLDASFINDLYFLGLALGDKFKYLRLCYNVFVIGVILSVIAFVIAFIRSSITG